MPKSSLPFLNHVIIRIENNSVSSNVEMSEVFMGKGVGEGVLAQTLVPPNLFMYCIVFR
jgi:hypothetical protein